MATVIVGAAARFAPTAYSRARLIQQMHASGRLTSEQVRRAQAVLDYDVITDDRRPRPGPGDEPGASR